MLNHIVIMGRLGRDPELRHTQSGTPVASFSLAVKVAYATPYLSNIEKLYLLKHS